MISGVNPPRPSALGDRFDEVMLARNIKGLPWSRLAGYSKDYVAVLRSRAAADPTYVLPEKAAKRLADAVKVSVEWLRFGRGTMESLAALPSPRMTHIHNTLQAIGEMVETGDIEGARISTVSLAKLLGVELPTAPPKETLASRPLPATPTRRATG
jgi:hypothetical protein